MKVDGGDYTRKAIYKLCLHCGPLKKQTVGTIKVKTQANSLKKEKKKKKKEKKNRKLNIQDSNLTSSSTYLVEVIQQ